MESSRQRCPQVLIVLLVVTTAWPLPPSAAAQERIFRQQDRSGNTVFSDVPAGGARTAYRIEGAAPARSAAGTACAGLGAVALDARAHQWRARIDRAARRHGLDPGLLEALVRVESCFDPMARSRAGATGLTQLMPATAAALGVREPFDAEQNLDGGARYLARMLTRYADEALALAAYNAGPGAVDRHGGVPPFQETQAYLARIARLRQRR